MTASVTCEINDLEMIEEELTAEGVPCVVSKESERPTWLTPATCSFMP
ncbi:hypothetical protein [Amycolatopsis jejuensis]|nr:hypothetical protein [Amycolatopsis jejuensis]